MWRSTFVPETIFRRCIRLKHTERTCWTIQTHWDDFNWATCRTFHELNSLSRGLDRAHQKFDVWLRPRQSRHFGPASKTTQPRPQVFLINGSITCNKAALLTSFWRHRFNMTNNKILSKFGKQQLVMVNYACGFNQSETGKYFEWIIR